MTVFDAYARYYDLFYSDKNYTEESEYVLSLLKNAGCTQPDRLLDLGCGTGGHARCFAAKGMDVVGIDLSETSIANADKKAAAMTGTRSPTYHCADIRTFRLGKTFDAVVSLFHVMSYQISDSDIQSAFETARIHLNEGGIFVFDCWHGPGVLTDPPVVRVRRYPTESGEVVRISEPEMDTDRNCVTVHYQVLAPQILGEPPADIRENHCMRYFFPIEVCRFLTNAGFALESHCAWMSDRPPGSEAWYAVYIARATAA